MELLFLVLFSLHILKTEVAGFLWLSLIVVFLWSPSKGSRTSLPTNNDLAGLTPNLGSHWCYQPQKLEQPHCEGVSSFPSKNTVTVGYFGFTKDLQSTEKDDFLHFSTVPRQWHLIDAACKGNKQSPINIVTKNITYQESLKPLDFEGYDVKGSSKWYIENNGHTVKVKLSTSPKIGGGGLERKYKAIEFHFHWGVEAVPQYLPGSEHSIDGEKQAMELHIVHIREDASNITEAKAKEDGVAVLAFFIKIEEENKNYETLISKLDNIKYKGQTADMDPLPLSSLLPPEKDLGKYYRYEGSLTTPDCYEGVIWTIFEKPIELSISQIAQFSTVHFDGKNSTNMVENFRPVQFLNERKVYWSSASVLPPPAKILTLVLVLTYILSSLSQ